MAGPIHKLFRASFSEAWYQLSEAEQDGLLKKVNEAREKAGGTNILLCDSSWTSEEWQFFGVETYPNIEAVQKHNELLREFDWFRYLKSSTLLGTATTV
jgi:hypothetical protein